MFDLAGEHVDVDALALALATIASSAGATIMDIYERPYKSTKKDNGSPLTEADLAADQVIAELLKRITPDIPVLSEETVDEVEPSDLGTRFFVVDPLDGTKEFISKNGDFTVNIALVDHTVPICGVVFAPAHQRIWLAGKTALTGKLVPGDPASEENLEVIRCQVPPPETLRALSSRLHKDPKTEAYLDSLGVCKASTRGSSLKLCLVAEGQADVYPRSSPTMVWDTAAGTAIIQAAGGVVRGVNDQPLRVAYGEDGWRNGPFVAWGCKGKASQHVLS